MGSEYFDIVDIYIQYSIKNQAFATPLQGGLPGIKKNNVWEKYINLIYLFNKKCYSKKLFIEV